MNTVTQKIFCACILTLSCNLHGVKRKQDARYWNTQDIQGATKMHGVVTIFSRAQGNFTQHIRNYKLALEQGGNQYIPNNKGLTPLDALKTCFNYQLCQAIINNNRKHMLELLAYAPELCSLNQPFLTENPLECALNNNNALAFILIKRCLQGTLVPLNPYDILNDIADHL